MKESTSSKSKKTPYAYVEGIEGKKKNSLVGGKIYKVGVKMSEQLISADKAKASTEEAFKKQQESAKPAVKKVEKKVEEPKK